MASKGLMNQKSMNSFFILPIMALGLLIGCTSTTKKEIRSVEPVEQSVIEQVKVTPSPSQVVVEITNSRSTPYTAFQLVEPPRLILDISGKPSGNLPLVTEIAHGVLREIRFEESKTHSMLTRMVANLADQVNYRVTAQDNVIRMVLTPLPAISDGVGQTEEAKASQIGPTMKDDVSSTTMTSSEERIFFKPRVSDLNQVLGIDFTMLDHGKSRLVVTTDKKVPYNLDQRGAKSLVLKLSNSTIPPLLLREVDAIHFPAAPERVRPSFSSAEKEVNITIFLREMVPYHVKQADNRLSIDFAKTSIQPPKKEIIPLNLTETKVVETSAPAAQPTTTQVPTTPVVKENRTMPIPQTTPIRVAEKKYKGEPMYLDFVNADVTHILRMINEISDENIIWDPVIAGTKVSMILKNIPWDQALDLILINANLARRYVGKDIIWITTKAKMNQIIAEEEAAALKAQQKIEEELKRKRELEEKAKEAEPLITEYIPVDFAGASEIQPHIILSERGKMSIDTRTNTIIIKDVPSSIEEAKKVVRQFDIPVKQIMIEARIVDATTDFSRDLGLRWGSDSQYWRRNMNVQVEVPPNANDFDYLNEKVWGGSFSTSAPDGWAGNIGLAFAQDFFGLGALTLDATLALAESEGKAKVMSAPKVIAREGTAATISSGDVIIIAATENVPSTTLDATLSLTVTPQSVSYNNFITLVITVTDDQAPSTQRLLTKNINTTLMIKSGDTFVIGGIIKESDSETESGIPGLRDVPILGWLFKAKRKVFQRSELLIFVTPTVLPSPMKTL